MKYIFTIFLGCFLQLVSSQTISIADARNAQNGEVVKIEGIILAGSEGGELRYIQDETAGLALFDGLSGSLSIQSLQKGDRVIIEGEKEVYQGLVELNRILSIEYLSPSNDLPDPVEVEFDQLADYQSQLVKLSCTRINTDDSTFSPGLYEINSSDGAQIIEMQIDNSSNANGQEVSATNVDIVVVNTVANDPIVILTEFENIQASSCLSFLEKPTISDITQNNADLRWSLSQEASYKLYLGKYGQPLNEIADELESQQTTFSLDGMDAGEIYNFQVIAFNDSDTINSAIGIFATVSESSGEIDVYFNNAVDESFSDGSLATGTTAAEFDSRLFQIIDAAEESIDIAMYNINRTIIVNYLIDAHNRGVTIRYIADDQTSNSAFNSASPPFGLVFGNAGSDLMHNKFVIVDKDIAEKAIVIMGATNFTTNQMAIDPNHMLVIQDQSLAKAYTIEFEEMWGSTDAVPNLLNARFGSDKLDNTPHDFTIGGRAVKSYFSPSDRLTSKIEQEIRDSENTISLGLLTLTKNELGEALADMRGEGVSIRIILENYDDIGSEYEYLKSNSIPVKRHLTNSIFHHKYGIFDEGGSNPRVLTGSHNWTNKAEFQNDENTLIIYDQSITNIFRQEFEKRYEELPTSTIDENQELSIYPNPVTSLLQISSDELINALEVYSLEGKMIIRAENTNILDCSTLYAGSYFLKVYTANAISHTVIIKH